MIILISENNFIAFALRLTYLQYIEILNRRQKYIFCLFWRWKGIVFLRSFLFIKLLSCLSKGKRMLFKRNKPYFLLLKKYFIYQILNIVYLFCNFPILRIDGLLRLLRLNFLHGKLHCSALPWFSLKHQYKIMQFL